MLAMLSNYGTDLTVLGLLAEKVLTHFAGASFFKTTLSLSLLCGVK